MLFAPFNTFSYLSKKKKRECLLFSEYLDLEIASISPLQVQDHEPFLLNKYFPEHKEQVPQCTGCYD